MKLRKDNHDNHVWMFLSMLTIWLERVGVRQLPTAEDRNMGWARNHVGTILYQTLGDSLAIDVFREDALETDAPSRLGGRVMVTLVLRAPRISAVERVFHMFAP